MTARRKDNMPTPGRRFAAVAVAVLVAVQAAVPLASAGEGGEKFNWGSLTGKIPTFGGAAIGGGIACTVLSGGACALAIGGLLAANAAVNFGINAYTHRGTDRSCFQGVEWFACAADSESFANHAAEFQEAPLQNGGWMALELGLSSLPVTKGGWAGVRGAAAVAGDKLLGKTASLASERAALGSLSASAKAAETARLTDTSLTLAERLTPTAPKAAGKGAAAGKAAQEFAARRASGLLGQSIKVDRATGAVAKQTNLFGKLGKGVSETFSYRGVREAFAKSGGTLSRPLRAGARYTATNTFRVVAPKAFLPITSFQGNPAQDVNTPDAPYCNGAAKPGDDWDGDGVPNAVEVQYGSDNCDPASTPGNLNGGPEGTGHASLVIESPDPGETIPDTQQVAVAVVVRATSGEELRAIVLSMNGVVLEKTYPSGGTAESAVWSRYLVYDGCTIPPGRYFVTLEAWTTRGTFRQQADFTVVATENSPCGEGFIDYGPGWERDYNSNDGRGTGGSDALDRVRSLMGREAAYDTPAGGVLPSWGTVLLVLALLGVFAYAMYRGHNWGKWGFGLTLVGTGLVVSLRAMDRYPALAIVFLLLGAAAVWYFVRRSVTTEVY